MPVERVAHWAYCQRYPPYRVVVKRDRWYFGFCSRLHRCHNSCCSLTPLQCVKPFTPITSFNPHAILEVSAVITPILQTRKLRSSLTHKCSSCSVCAFNLYALLPFLSLSAAYHHGQLTKRWPETKRQGADLSTVWAAWGEVGPEGGLGCIQILPLNSRQVGR